MSPLAGPLPRVSPPATPAIRLEAVSLAGFRNKRGLAATLQSTCESGCTGKGGNERRGTKPANSTSFKRNIKWRLRRPESEGRRLSYRATLHNLTLTPPTSDPLSPVSFEPLLSWFSRCYSLTRNSLRPGEDCFLMPIRAAYGELRPGTLWFIHGTLDKGRTRGDILK